MGRRVAEWESGWVATSGSAQVGGWAGRRVTGVECGHDGLVMGPDPDGGAAAAARTPADPKGALLCYEGLAELLAFQGKVCAQHGIAIVGARPFASYLALVCCKGWPGPGRAACAPGQGVQCAGSNMFGRTIEHRLCCSPVGLRACYAQACMHLCI